MADTSTISKDAILHYASVRINPEPHCCKEARANLPAYRAKFRIREATKDELERMTEEQKWHYNACALKPIGLPFEFFFHEQRPVYALGLLRSGKIEIFPRIGAAEILAALAPWPIEYRHATHLPLL